MTKSTKNGNGTLKVVGIVVTVLIFAATVIVGFVYNYGSHDEKVLGIEKDVAVMMPDVKANTKHRHQFEEKVTNIETDVKSILTIVRDLEKSE